MEGEKSLQRFSPELRIGDPSIRNVVSLLPPISLLHGTADNSLPSSSRIQLRGGEDGLFEHLVAVIHADNEEALAKDAMAPPRRRLVAELFLTLARLISPF